MTDSSSSLRSLLGARPDPEFQLSLPRGWERMEPTQEAQDELERRLSRRFMHADGGPETMQAFARIRGMLRQAVKDMREQRVIASFAPTADTDDVPFPVPASIVATIRTAPSTEEMDGYVKNLISSEGARPLTDNTSILRVERENIREEGGERVVLSSTLYVTPVPGARRRRALELLAGYARPADIPREDEQIQAVHAFFDLMVATLRWREASVA
ncbi:hypothetical protein [Microbacterium sp. gxy059]|uniref:hypothetical protein n=1 Tax=Microbacterium sp. gxy059 TaxID=2957199 RepID=UPI003D969A77